MPGSNRTADASQNHRDPLFTVVHSTADVGR
jgi:hypothetical protein